MHDEETREYEVRHGGNASATPGGGTPKSPNVPEARLPLRPVERSSRRRRPIAAVMGALIGLTMFWLWDDSPLGNSDSPEPPATVAAAPTGISMNEPAPVAAGAPELDVSAAGTASKPPQPTALLRAQPPAASALASPEPSPARVIQIQLLSGRSSDGAERARKRLLKKHGDLLAGLDPAVITADLGARGVYYRLRAGPLASEAAAETVCATLTAREQSCIVVREDGT